MVGFNVGAIGFGNMIGALFRGAVHKGVLNPSLTKVWSPSLAAGTKSAAPFIVAKNNCDAIEGAKIVFLGTKPKDIKSVCEKIRPVVHNKMLFVTMVAGLKTAQLAEYLSLTDPSIFSMMPNTPVSVGFGVTGYYKTPAVTEEQTNEIMPILQATSLMKYFPEEQIDAVTAFTGCGTGYLLYLLQYYVEGAIEMGIDKDTAQEMAIASMKGVAELMKVSALTFEEERLRVTSKGGATEEAIRHYTDAHLGTLFKKGMHIAHAKAQKLGTPANTIPQFGLFPSAEPNGIPKPEWHTPKNSK